MASVQARRALCIVVYFSINLVIDTAKSEYPLVDPKVKIDVEGLARLPGLMCEGCPRIVDVELKAQRCAETPHEAGKHQGLQNACIVTLSFQTRSHPLYWPDAPAQTQPPNARVSITFGGQPARPIRTCTSGLECDEALHALRQEGNDMAQADRRDGHGGDWGGAVCHVDSCWVVATGVATGEHRFRLRLLGSGGGGGGGVGEDTALRGRGQEVSPWIAVPFLLLAHRTSAGEVAFGLTALPWRLFPQSAQHVPHSVAVEEANARLLRRRRGLEGEAEQPEEGGDGACSSASTCRVGGDGEWGLGGLGLSQAVSDFHPLHRFDLSAEPVPDQVWIGGLGKYPLTWPAGVSGPDGEANVFRVVPITYAAYQEHVREDPLPKVFDFAPYRPGAMSGFRHLRMYGPLDQAHYFDDYSRSYFGFTRKKAGWDCMRHYEILAAGCIPYFLDLAECPSNSLRSFPKELVLEAMGMDGVEVHHSEEGLQGRINHAVFNHTRYYSLLRRIQAWTWEHLTTVQLARRVLRVMNISEETADDQQARPQNGGGGGSGSGQRRRPKVLFVAMEAGWAEGGTFDEGGNLRDMLFHGLRRLLGADAVDVFPLNHLYADALPDPAGMAEGEWAREEALLRNKMHAFGFFHSAHLSPRLEIDREDVEERLRKREFDLVVMGSVCHDMLARRDLDDVTAAVPDEFPFWRAITQHYPPSKVALIDGDDMAPLPCKHWNCFCTCLRRYGPYGTYFFREMPAELNCSYPEVTDT